MLGTRLGGMLGHSGILSQCGNRELRRGKASQKKKAWKCKQTLDRRKRKLTWSENTCPPRGKKGKKNAEDGGQG